MVHNLFSLFRHCLMSFSFLLLRMILNLVSSTWKWKEIITDI